MSVNDNLSADQNFIANGLRFECQGSGKCCSSRGEYGFVYLTKLDRQRMAKYLKLSTTAFTKTYCAKTNGIWHLRSDNERPDCQFLQKKQCGIYDARPTQCRTWPFWPEVLNAKSWSKEVTGFCAGVGKGRLWTKEEIQKISEEDRKNTLKFGT
jgi:uncharacterized protein